MTSERNISDYTNLENPPVLQFDIEACHPDHRPGHSSWSWDGHTGVKICKSCSETYNLDLDKIYCVDKTSSECGCTDLGECITVVKYPPGSTWDVQIAC